MFYVKNNESKNLFEIFNLKFQDFEKILHFFDSLQVTEVPKISEDNKEISEKEFEDNILKIFKFVDNIKKELKNSNLSNDLKAFYIAFILFNNPEFRFVAKVLSKEIFNEDVNLNFNNLNDILRFIDSLYFDEESLNALFTSAAIAYFINHNKFKDYSFDFREEEV